MIKVLLKILLLVGVFGLSGCTSLAESLKAPVVVSGSPFAVVTSDFGCPHPREEVEKAEKYVANVHFLPLDELREIAIEKQKAGGGSAEDVRPLLAGFWSEPNIYINSDRTKEDQQHSYLHELCHVYEEKVLEISHEDVVNHRGWIPTGDPILLGVFQSSL